MERPSPTLSSSAPVIPRVWSLALIGLALVASAAVLADLSGPVRAVPVGVAMLVVPGAAALPWSGRIDTWARAAITVGLSMAIGTVVALAMMWSKWWHPVAIGVAMLLAGAVVLFFRDARPRHRGRQSRTISGGNGSRTRPGLTDLVGGAGLLIAAALWVIGLVTTSSTNLGQWGLLAAFGPAWFAGLAVNLGVLVWALISSRRWRSGWLAAHLALLVVILYGSASALAQVPRLPWVYKHIAVTRYLELHGSVDPTIDIYQRWPGFFAWTAQLAQLIGMPDPVTWARLAEPGFMLVDALLVLAIARTISRDPRWCWTVTTIYCLTNWVAQNYFAPQALGYTLYLLIALLLLTALRTDPRSVGQRLEAGVARLFRARPIGSDGDLTETDRLPGAAGERMPRPWVLAVVLLAFAATVASHQLTPYVTLLALVPLFLLGYLRPLMLAVGMVGITLAYLIPNFDYIQEHFGLFSGFDPVANAVYSAVDRSSLLPGAVWQARGTQLISGLTYLLAAIGLVRRARAGSVRTALMVAWLMVAPALLLAVQSYGGEGRLRVFLFSLPWAAVAAAWAFQPDTRALRGRLRAALATVLAVLAVLFTLSYYQPEADYQVARADVVAAQWMDTRAQSGDVILPVAQTFPLLVGPHYDLIGLDGALSDYKQYFPDALTPDDVRTIARSLAGEPGANGVYVAFSPAQLRYAEEHGLYAPGELDQLERALRDDPSTELVYDRYGVRIYRVGM